MIIKITTFVLMEYLNHLVKMIAVYKIQNKVTNDIYIGASIKAESRWTRHKKDLRNGNHHSIILQKAYNEFGLDNFEFSIIEIVELHNKLDKEQYYLELFKPIYNISKFASHPTKGRKMSKENIEKKRKFAIENNIRPPKETWEKKQKKVIQLNKDTLEFIAEFNSISQACRHLGKTYTSVNSIAHVCNGKRKIGLGYKWRWS